VTKRYGRGIADIFPKLARFSMTYGVSGRLVTKIYEFKISLFRCIQVYLRKKKNTIVVLSMLDIVSLRFVISHRILSANKMTQLCSCVGKFDGCNLV
jgi:aromatic ring-opening dioxygenase LigB subunit